MSTKQNLCRQVVFSQNCCFVANFVDKALVDDSTTGSIWNERVGSIQLLLSSLPIMVQIQACYL